MTTKQAAAVMGRSEDVVRRFASTRKVDTVPPRLGDGRVKHYLTRDMIEKLREHGYVEEAARLEEWHRLEGAQPAE